MSNEELRTLNAEVHRWVMGRGGACWCGPSADGYDPHTGKCKRCGCGVCPRYSTDIAAAWAVLDHLPFESKRVHVVRCDDEDRPLRVVVALSRRRLAFNASMVHEIVEYASSVPLAICRAALAAMEGKTNG